MCITRFVAFFAVRLSQKFQKLFTRDAIESLWEHARRWTHPVSSRRILGTIERAELVRLREGYPYRSNARKINAYEDANYWVGVNVKRIQDLWLDRSPPLHILDLGCGPGYFLYLCRMFGSIPMTSLSFAARPSSLELIASSRESMRKRFYPIWAKNSTSLPHIASVSTGSDGAKMVSGWNGQRLIGDFSSTMCGHDFSNLTGDCFWNSIGEQMARHSLHQTCGHFLKHKARGSFVGKRYLQRIRISDRDSNRYSCSRARGARPWSAPPLQLPI